MVELWIMSPNDPPPTVMRVLNQFVRHVLHTPTIDSVLGKPERVRFLHGFSTFCARIRSLESFSSCKNGG